MFTGRSMSVLAAVAAVALSATQTDPVLVVGYQSLGVDEATAAKLGDGFRVGANKGALAAMSAEESNKSGRAAVMCGEDAACLATIGKQSAAKYVLAYGVGKVGNSLLVSALFIDVTSGKEITRASKRVLDPSPDWSLVTRELSDLVVKPPAEPLVVQVPVPVPVEVQRPHKLRTGGFISLGIAFAFGIVTTAVGLAAWSNFNSLKAATSIDARKSLAAQQTIVNFWGDACLTVSVLAAGLGLLFLILDLRDPPPTTFETSPVVPPTSW
jgi:hypothetical protein